LLTVLAGGFSRRVLTGLRSMLLTARATWTGNGFYGFVVDNPIPQRFRKNVEGSVNGCEGRADRRAETNYPGHVDSARARAAERDYLVESLGDYS